MQSELHDERDELDEEKADEDEDEDDEGPGAAATTAATLEGPLTAPAHSAEVAMALASTRDDGDEQCGARTAASSESRAERVAGAQRQSGATAPPNTTAHSPPLPLLLCLHVPEAAEDSRVAEDDEGA
eukprot:m51a1_g8091 hypothetical protein (128) ;mRNA; r:53016-53399